MHPPSDIRRSRTKSEEMLSNGSYFLAEHHIYIQVGATTEIYDATGWEERMLAALNDATVCEVDYYGRTMRIYYDLNRKYMEFIRINNFYPQ